ncbi:MAG: YkgJ family cysteine cluster protein [Thermoplasmatota archaeon]
MPTSSTYRNICTQCKAYCCTLVTPPITEKEKQKILKAGFPDHFEKIEKNLYTIKSEHTNKCPYLKNDYSCSIHTVKPHLCNLWPVVPYNKNNTRGCLLIKCPLFPFLSKKTIDATMKKAATIPLPLVEHLWKLPSKMKEKYKKFDYKKI